MTLPCGIPSTGWSGLPSTGWSTGWMDTEVLVTVVSIGVSFGISPRMWVQWLDSATVMFQVQGCCASQYQHLEYSATTESIRFGC